MKSREIQTVAHQIRLRELRVAKVEDITSHLRRITFVGDDLADFVSLSPDDHVKVFFPYPGEDKPVLPQVGAQGLVIPERSRKPIMRDYTPRHFDAHSRELVIEFVLHGEGPGSQWASTASEGQTLIIGGPRGSRIVPYNFDWYLMVGDESALPSFARRLAKMPPDAKALVVLEAADSSRHIELAHNGFAQIYWLDRNGQAAGSPDTVKDFLSRYSFPTGDYFAWVSLEKKCAMEIQELLLTLKGARKEWVKAAGYWTKGH